MEKQQTIPLQVRGALSGLLRQHFGKGPLHIHVTFHQPYLVISLNGFLSSAEAVLLKHNESQRILEVRDLLMKELQFKIKMEISKIVGERVTALYTDWNLEHQSGVLIAVLDGPGIAEELPWPGGVDKDRFAAKVIEASKQAQRTPDLTEIFWLSEQVVLIKRTGIFVQIETELIKGGFVGELKIVKKPLELRMIQESNLDADLKGRIKEIFVDWDFEGDKGFMVLILNPS